MRLIAHRGFGDAYPENSLTAVRRAAEDADMIEIDVRHCGSGELVVTHDETVDADGGETRVDELTADELAASEAHDGEGVATLDSIVDAIPASVGINVELKDAGVIEDALSVAGALENRVIVSSFDADALREVRASASGVALAYILDATHEDDIETALSLDCAFVHPHESVCLLTDVIEDAHEAGMGVNAWTVDSRMLAWALSRRGVDGLIADSPNVL